MVEVWRLGEAHFTRCRVAPIHVWQSIVGLPTLQVEALYFKEHRDKIVLYLFFLYCRFLSFHDNHGRDNDIDERKNKTQIQRAGAGIREQEGLK